MINVLEEVKKQDGIKIEYEDEKIASNVYLISLSKPLRSIDGLTGDKLEKAKEQNEWVYRICPKSIEIRVLDFDNIKNLLKIGLKSCDGLFYNFVPNGEELHYLVELKNTGKKELLELMDDILLKVKNSVTIIQKLVEFGGAQEHEIMIQNTHFIIVYNGKNNIPVQNTSILLPGKQKINNESGKRKQNRASKMDYRKQKDEDGIYVKFGKEIVKFGLCGCDEDTFPGNTLPKAKKAGKKKYREFSILSVRDFAEIIENGFFDNWKWGEYSLYF